MRFTITAALLLLLSLGSVASAHPPSEIRLNYDGEKKLEVRVIHGVDNGSKHFIDKVEVRLDSKLVAEKVFASQLSPKGLVVAFPLGSLAPGTVIAVRAHCNIFGSREVTYRVP